MVVLILWVLVVYVTIVYGPIAALLNDSTMLRELMSTNTALRDLLVDFKANPGRYIRLRL